MYVKYIKPLLDFTLSIIAVVVLVPIMCLIAILIILDSKGPPLFMQERIGKNGESFKLYKFRTMVIGAEKIGDGICIRSESDTRITKVGSFLRKTSLDELPQIFNIARGDMSLVGPRPPVVYHPYNGVENYPQWAKQRFALRPGLTGLAQIRLRNSAPWDERIVVDVEYVNNVSFLLDIKILALTLIKVVKRESIYGESLNTKRSNLDV